MDAFRVCITYLNLDFLNVDAADEMSQLRHLLNGDYHLLSYANSYWVNHLRECLRLRPDSTTMIGIVELLSQFLRARKANITESMTSGSLSLCMYTLSNVSEVTGQGTSPTSKMKQEIGPLALLETVEGMDRDHLAIIFAVVSHNSKLDTKYKENISVQGT